MRLIALAALACAGCASSSGVFQTGPDTYQITTSAFTSSGGAGTARGAAIKTAIKYCEQMGLHLVVIGTTTQTEITQGTSDVRFKCMKDGIY